MNTSATRAHDKPHPQLAGSLGLAARLISAAEAIILPRLGPGPGVIELPPVLGAEGDQAQLRTVSPLYLCSELESARLLPVVEKLASLFALGGLQADPGHAAPLLAAFWQKRNERFTAQERMALFARLFGSEEGPAVAGPQARNQEFLVDMIDLAGALAHVGSDPIYGRTPSAEEAVRTSAETVAANLLPRSGGITLFAAREIVSSVHEAIAILENKAVQGIAGQHNVWGAVSAFSRLYLGEEPDVTDHLDAGRAGAILLAWVAEVSPNVESSAISSLVPQDEILAAASAWLSATMALHPAMNSDASVRGT
jgi:hypothetical protein